MTSTQVKRNDPLNAQAPLVSIRKYKLDTMLNHTVLYYNRTLISRAKTFFHQATVNKTQNAAAEADFVSKIAAV